MAVIAEKLNALTRAAFGKQSPEPTRNPMAVLPADIPPSLTQLQARRRWLETELDGLNGSGWEQDCVVAAARHSRPPFATDVEAILRGGGLDAAPRAGDDLRRELRGVIGAIERLQATNDVCEAHTINERSAEETTLLRAAVARARAGSVADLPTHAAEIKLHTDELVHLLRCRGMLIRPEALVALPVFIHDPALESAALLLITAAEYITEGQTAYAPSAK